MRRRFLRASRAVSSTRATRSNGRFRPSSPSCASAAWSKDDAVTGPAAAEAEDLAAPLYVAWQITNECNLACLHCIEESGPGKAFPDELEREQIFAVLDQLLEREVPYLSFSGGEPMLHPHFFDMVEHACGGGAQLKIETNAHYLDRGNAARLKELGVNAVKAWRHLEPSEEQYTAFFDTLRAKAEEYRGRMRVYYHEAGLLEELRYRVQHPAALLIVLPNGLVKLINALPFICGDFRRDSLDEIWANFRRAWRDPRVAGFVEELAAEPGRTRTLHQWVHL